ncbi:MAG: glycosyltransferase family 39 protein [Lewinellaceae bacterium]|nr:glycosyltransferase family 39 protein [Lewinellaceae bacterium]
MLYVYGKFTGLQTLPKSFFIGALVLLFALRFWHFGAEIDAPHDWRQCDTAYYILDFYKNGVDLLYPAVCWMGSSDTLALEFPLPEAVVALAYRAFGESIPLARLIFLCFFAGALYYFYHIADVLFGRATAQLATLCYLALPLGIYYSRAVHIDFAALLPAHAMLYYFLLGVEKRRWPYILLSSLAAALAFVIKAPYTFCFFLPMLFFAIRQKALGWTFRFSGFYALPLALFCLWQYHVKVINGAAPDLGYILHYRKMTQSASWYFGTLQQRLSLYPWWILLQRGVWEVAGAGGMFFFLLGWRNLNRLPHLRFLLFWMLGLVLYVLVFFNLNFVHNYYQIPLLAPVAVLCARGLQTAASQKPGLLYLFFGLLTTANVAYTELYYFKVSADHVEIARLIRQHTPDTALVIVTYQNLDCRNPKILYRARRRGWSVEETALRPEVIERLHREEGARFWAYAGTALPQKQMLGYLAALPEPGVFEVAGNGQKLYIFDLSLK